MNTSLLKIVRGGGRGFLALLVISVVVASIIVISGGVIEFGLDVDGGIVHRGGQLTHTVRLLNISPTTVVVFEEPTCGCQVTPLRRIVIHPLQHVTFSTTYQLSPDDRGPRRKSMMLEIQQNGTTRSVLGTMSYVSE